MAVYKLIKLKRDYAANWTLRNPTLSLGEPGYERDSGKLKIGDGVTPWVDLEYIKVDMDDVVIDPDDLADVLNDVLQGGFGIDIVYSDPSDTILIRTTGLATQSDLIALSGDVANLDSALIFRGITDPTQPNSAPTNPAPANGDMWISNTEGKIDGTWVNLSGQDIVVDQFMLYEEDANGWVLGGNAVGVDLSDYATKAELNNLQYQVNQNAANISINYLDIQKNIVDIISLKNSTNNQQAQIDALIVATGHIHDQDIYDLQNADIVLSDRIIANSGRSDSRDDNLQAQINAISGATPPEVDLSVISGYVAANTASGVVVLGKADQNSADIVTLSGLIDGGLDFKGYIDPTATGLAPSSPINGDLWVSDSSGVIDNGWTCLGGQDVGVNQWMIYSDDDSCWQLGPATDIDLSAYALKTELDAVSGLVDQNADDIVVISGLLGSGIPSGLVEYSTGLAIRHGNTEVSVNEVSGNSVIDLTNWKIKDGHFIPNSNAAFDLGNAEYKVRHLFLSDNSIYMGSGKLSSQGNDNPVLLWEGEPLAKITDINTIISGELAEQKLLDLQDVTSDGPVEQYSVPVYNQGTTEYKVKRLTPLEVEDTSTPPLDGYPVGSLGNELQDMKGDIQSNTILISGIAEDIVEIPDAVIFKGVTDPTVSGSAPAGPDNGDMWVSNNSGLIDGSWTGLSGEEVVQNQFLLYSTGLSVWLKGGKIDVNDLSDQYLPLTGNLNPNDQKLDAVAFTSKTVTTSVSGLYPDEDGGYIGILTYKDEPHYPAPDDHVKVHAYGPSEFSDDLWKRNVSFGYDCVTIGYRNQDAEEGGYSWQVKVGAPTRAYPSGIDNRGNPYAAFRARDPNATTSVPAFEAAVAPRRGRGGFEYAPYYDTYRVDSSLDDVNAPYQVGFKSAPYNYLSFYKIFEKDPFATPQYVGFHSDPWQQVFGTGGGPPSKGYASHVDFQAGGEFAGMMGDAADHGRVYGFFANMFNRGGANCAGFIERGADFNQLQAPTVFGADTLTGGSDPYNPSNIYKPTDQIDLVQGGIRIRNAKLVQESTSGNPGQIGWDQNGLLCYTSSSWKRAPLLRFTTTVTNPTSDSVALTVDGVEKVTATAGEASLALGNQAVFSVGNNSKTYIQKARITVTPEYLDGTGNSVISIWNEPATEQALGMTYYGSGIATNNTAMNIGPQAGLIHAGLAPLGLLGTEEVLIGTSDGTTHTERLRITSNDIKAFAGYVPLTDNSLVTKGSIEDGTVSARLPISSADDTVTLDGSTGRFSVDVDNYERVVVNQTGLLINKTSIPAEPTLTFHVRDLGDNEFFYYGQYAYLRQQNDTPVGISLINNQAAGNANRGIWGIAIGDGKADQNDLNIWSSSVGSEKRAVFTKDGDFILNTSTGKVRTNTITTLTAATGDAAVSLMNDQVKLHPHDTDRNLANTDYGMDVLLRKSSIRILNQYGNEDGNDGDSLLRIDTGFNTAESKVEFGVGGTLRTTARQSNLGFNIESNNSVIVNVGSGNVTNFQVDGAGKLTISESDIVTSNTYSPQGDYSLVTKKFLTVSNLDDVEFPVGPSPVSADQILRYSTINNKWVNSDAGTANLGNPPLGGWPAGSVGEAIANGAGAATLPISSVDGTVTLASPSADVFTVSTAGQERIIAGSNNQILKLGNATGYTGVTQYGLIVNPTVPAECTNAFYSFRSSPILTDTTATLYHICSYGRDDVPEQYGFYYGVSTSSPVKVGEVGFRANKPGIDYAFYADQPGVPSYFAGQIQTNTITSQLAGSDDALIQLGATFGVNVGGSRKMTIRDNGTAGLNMNPTDSRAFGVKYSVEGTSNQACVVQLLQTNVPSGTEVNNLYHLQCSTVGDGTVNTKATAFYASDSALPTGAPVRVGLELLLNDQGNSGTYAIYSAGDAPSRFNAQIQTNTITTELAAAGDPGNVQSDGDKVIRLKGNQVQISDQDKNYATGGYSLDIRDNRGMFRLRNDDVENGINDTATIALDVNNNNYNTSIEFRTGNNKRAEIVKQSIAGNQYWAQYCSNGSRAGLEFRTAWGTVTEKTFETKPEKTIISTFNQQNDVNLPNYRGIENYVDRLTITADDIKASSGYIPQTDDSLVDKKFLRLDNAADVNFPDGSGPYPNGAFDNEVLMFDANGGQPGDGEWKANAVAYAKYANSIPIGGYPAGSLGEKISSISAGVATLPISSVDNNLEIAQADTKSFGFNIQGSTAVEISQNNGGNVPTIKIGDPQAFGTHGVSVRNSGTSGSSQAHYRLVSPTGTDGTGTAYTYLGVTNPTFTFDNTVLASGAAYVASQIDMVVGAGVDVNDVTRAIKFNVGGWAEVNTEMKIERNKVMTRPAYNYWGCGNNYDTENARFYLHYRGDSGKYQVGVCIPPSQAQMNSDFVVGNTVSGASTVSTIQSRGFATIQYQQFRGDDGYFNITRQNQNGVVSFASSEDSTGRGSENIMQFVPTTQAIRMNYNVGLNCAVGDTRLQVENPGISGTQATYGMIVGGNMGSTSVITNASCRQDQNHAQGFYAYNSVSAGATLGTLYCYRADSANTMGGDLNSHVGYYAGQNIMHGTGSNIGFSSAVVSGESNYAFFSNAQGTQSYMRGNVGIGTNQNQPAYKLVVSAEEDDSYTLRVGNQAGGAGNLRGTTRIGIDAWGPTNTHSAVALMVNQHATTSNWQGDLHIQMRQDQSDSLPVSKFVFTPEGNLGVNASGVSEALVAVDVNSDRIAIRDEYTPAALSSDTIGEIAWDDDYIWIRTTAGWKKSPLYAFDQTPSLTVRVTQAEYDGLTPDPDITYVIVG